VFSKKSNAGDITMPDVKLHYTAIAIKTAWYCHKTDIKTSGTEQKTRTWVHTATPTFFLTKVPKSYDGEYTASSTSVAGKSGYLPAEN
jgi:hypothetical protein